MTPDPFLPVAPARVKTLVLPIGRIKRDRFDTFVRSLNTENVVQLRDVTADGRPNRSRDHRQLCPACVQLVSTAQVHESSR